MFLRCGLVLTLLARSGLAQTGLNFVVAGGQIFTPGLAILDAPQPGTPLGGGSYPPRQTKDYLLTPPRADRGCTGCLNERQDAIAAVRGGQSEQDPQHYHFPLQL